MKKEAIMVILAFFVLILYLAFIALLIFLNYYIAKQFEAVANMKGHFLKRYFWLCFFFGVAGYLLVIALPTVEKTNKKFCTCCGHEVSDDSSFCPLCGNRIS